MSLFPTKFVCDVDTLEVYSDDTLAAAMTVNSARILAETYSPADGKITVRGLRSVLEAALYGELGVDTQGNGSADVVFTIGSQSEQRTLFAARLKNPRDPDGAKTLLAAGDLVAVVDSKTGALITPVNVTRIMGSTVVTDTLTTVTDGSTLGDDIRIWVDRTSCADNAVAVRFLNRYDMPQTMMTVRPLDIKPGFTDETERMYGKSMRFAVEQNDEYTLRSGRIHSRQEYASWYDLITSRQAELLMNGRWLPILVTKSNFTIVSRSMGLQPVEIGFRMADPKQGL